MRLLVFGLGYVGSAVARAAAAAGFAVTGTRLHGREATATLRRRLRRCDRVLARATHLLGRAARCLGRSGPVASWQRHRGGAPPALDRLSVHHRRLWRPRRRLGRRGHRARADVGSQPTAARGGGRLAAIGRSLCGRSVPPGRHLRPRPLGVRRSARGHGAAHHQAGPRVRPHPSRRHRRAPCWRRCGRSARLARAC